MCLKMYTVLYTEKATREESPGGRDNKTERITYWMRLLKSLDNPPGRSHRSPRVAKP